MMLLRVADENPQKALDAIRDADPYYQAGVVQYELLVLERRDRERRSRQALIRPSVTTVGSVYLSFR